MPEKESSKQTTFWLTLCVASLGLYLLFSQAVVAFAAELLRLIRKL